ncbi:MAG: hypothetical protein IT373_01190 [Polyangiaceae bacterium]|nr:hypothetical protein [Polyangiaceae bacterium]
MRLAPALALCALACLACGGTPLRPLPRMKAPVGTAEAPVAAPDEGPPPLTATTVAHLPWAEGDGVIVARRGRAGIIVEARSGRLWTYAFDASVPATDVPLLGGAAPSGGAGAKDAGPLPTEATSLTARPLKDGYLVAWAQGDPSRPEIAARALDAAGAPVGETRVLGSLGGGLRWLDVLPNAAGALLVVEVSREGARDVLVAAWPPAGSAAPVEVARDVAAWHAVATDGGAAFVYVERGDTAAPPRGPARGTSAAAERSLRVRLREVDGGGVARPALDVAAGPDLVPDVQVAALATGYLVAWTQGSDEPSVRVATVARGGGVEVAAHAPLPRLGEQALVSLVASGDGARGLVVWEDLAARRRPREFRLNVLSPQGELVAGAEAVVELDALGDPDAANAVPHVVPNGAGFLAVTLAPLELTGSEPAASRRSAPHFVHFGPRLAIEASEPVRLPNVAGGGLPYLTRAEQCDGALCTALCTTQSDPAPLWVVELARRAGSWRVPAHILPPTQAPYAERLSTLATVEGLATDVGAGGASRGGLVGWLGRPDANGLTTLGTRVVAADGTAGATSVLAPKALAAGGLGVAPVGGEGQAPKSGTGKRATAALAWAAMNESAPQVFVGLVADDGSKLTQKVLTYRRRAAKGVVDDGVSWVDLAPDGRGGYVAAWVDGRDGDTEVYAARLDAELNRRGAERRVTSAPGDASEVSVLVLGDRVFLAWGDAREDPSGGSADIYLAQLEGDALTPTGPERALMRSAAHSRTPSFAASSVGPLLAWIEEPRDGSAPASARIARLDELGRARGDVDTVAAADAVTAIALGCVGTVCRGVVAHGGATERVIEVFVLPASQAGVGPRKPVWTLGGPLDELVPLSPDLAAVAFVDRERVRRLGLRW